MPKAPRDLAVFTANAEHVADVLRALANERRLMILCKLVEWGEATVGTLVEAVGLSQSALSQHLAKMREEGIVTYRRESQTLWYRIADPRTETLLGHLQQLYCPPEAPASEAQDQVSQGKSKIMSLPIISPTEAKRLLDQGATLIDIRGRDEHARERIEGARNHPVENLTTLDGDTGIAIFHCRSGQRTAMHAGKLAEAAGCEAYIVEGGIEAWKKAGLPVARDRSQPIEIQRQVMIAAGSLVLLGVLLGQFVAPAFYAVPAFVGAGLTFAGMTGWCGMAKLLALMPWNRSTATAA